MFRILTISIALMLSSTLSAQEFHEILESFTVRQIDNTIRADFGIIGGASCFGVNLERLNDEGEYETVGVIPGVCGGGEFTEFYSITDMSPFPNQMNTYRLLIGNQGRSVELEVFFVPLSGELVVYPNPASDFINIRWDAAEGEIWTFSLHSANGKNLTGEIKVMAPITRVNLPSINGLVFIQLMNADGTRILKEKVFLQ